VIAAEGAWALGGDDRSHLRQIEPGGEMIAVTEDHTDTNLRILAESFVRRTELVDGLQVEGVALFGAIDADEKHVVVAFYGDPLAHGARVSATTAPSVNVVEPQAPGRSGCSVRYGRMASRRG
jgi:hypothetical protein